jgi:hypothetical protein
VFWGAAVVVVGHQVLHQPVFFLVVAVGLCFLFVLVNGISLGISDWNPISSAFVMTSSSSRRWACGIRARA